MRNITLVPTTIGCRKVYDIHHRRFFYSKKDRVIIAAGLPNLRAARDHRAVSGDLVVYHNTNRIVPSIRWLFDWERKDLGCYARKAIKHSEKDSK